MAAPTIAQQAQHYVELGWSVIPLRPGTKEPAVPTWIPYREKAATAEQVCKWYRDDPMRNVGIITGTSGLLVVDTDTAEGLARVLELGIPDTRQVDTGRGKHLYFKHPGGQIADRIGLLPGVDIKASGYVVAPPSVRDTGEPWTWVDPDAIIADPPAWLLEKLAGQDSDRQGARPASVYTEIARNGAVEGERNSRLCQMTGHLLSKRVHPVTVMELMLGWNESRNTPPEAEREVIRVVDYLAGKHLAERMGGAE